MRPAAAILLALLAPSTVRAEPVLAARTGLTCGACHLNRTGGGGRTAYGAGYGAQSLPWVKLAQGHGLFDGAIGDRVRLGFDGRGGYFATFRDPGPYIGEAKVTEADLYLGAELIKDRLSVYVDEHIAPGGASAREAFALFALDKAGFYVKGGKFFLPFGLRLQDDDAASRRGTGVTMETADIGAETGFDTGAWTGSLSITNGTSGGAETDNGKQYCVSAARVWTLGRIGVSGSFNDLPAGAESSLAGAFGTFRVDWLVVLAEADLTQADDGVSAKRKGGAGHLEVDALAHAGLTVRLWGGAYDLDRSDGVTRTMQWGVGLDWTPLPGLQIRSIYRARNGPDSVPGSNDDQASVEAHVYF